MRRKTHSFSLHVGSWSLPKCWSYWPLNQALFHWIGSRENLQEIMVVPCCSNEIRRFPMNFPYTNPMTYYTRSCLSIIPLWNSRQKSSCPLVDITASHPSSELSILNWLIHNTCYNAGIVGIRVMRWDGICSAFIYYLYIYIIIS